MSPEVPRTLPLCVIGQNWIRGPPRGTGEAGKGGAGCHDWVLEQWALLPCTVSGICELRRKGARMSDMRTNRPATSRPLQEHSELLTACGHSLLPLRAVLHKHLCYFPLPVSSIISSGWKAAYVRATLRAGTFKGIWIHITTHLFSASRERDASLILGPGRLLHPHPCAGLNWPWLAVSAPFLYRVPPKRALESVEMWSVFAIGLQRLIATGLSSLLTKAWSGVHTVSFWAEAGLLTFPLKLGRENSRAFHHHLLKWFTDNETEDWQVTLVGHSPAPQRLLLSLVAFQENGWAFGIPKPPVLMSICTSCRRAL